MDNGNKDYGNKSTPNIVPLVTNPEMEGYGDQTSWLIQPMAVSMMYQEYGLSQIRTMLTVIRQLQTPINNVINGADANGELQLFKQNDFNIDDSIVGDGIVLQLRLKDLTADHTQYKEIRKVIERMSTMKISYIHHNRDGRDLRIVEPFIAKFIFPVGKKRIHSFNVVLSRNIAEMIINMDGYSWHRILENVILESTNTATQCLYLYLSAMRKREKRNDFEVPTAELRRQAGTSHIVYGDSGEIVGEKVGYKQWGMFVKNVLDVAVSELKEKYEAKKCDIWFRWSPIYNEGRARKGEPDFVRIETISFEDSQLEAAPDNTLDMEPVRSMIVDTFGIRVNNFGYFRKKITSRDLLEDFVKELHRINNDVKGDKRTPKYFYACCKASIDILAANRRGEECNEKPTTTSAIDSNSAEKLILDNLRFEFGSGQMGYDYYFGSRAQCMVEGTIAILYVPSSVVQPLATSNNNVAKIKKAVCAVLGAVAEYDIKPL